MKSITSSGADDGADRSLAACDHSADGNGDGADGERGHNGVKE